MLKVWDPTPPAIPMKRNAKCCWPRAVVMPPMPSWEDAGQPRSVSSRPVVRLASASSPERKTVPGSVSSPGAVIVVESTVSH